ncbi:unnamed protein product [Meloidogyne enterolobii]|uniref:Uncharacterized protein n=1 Tax=Meloidogyne enterolobii TaxID=390850 RepID=A0ACB0Y6F6_MELEN
MIPLETFGTFSQIFQPLYSSLKIYIFFTLDGTVIIDLTKDAWPSLFICFIGISIYFWFWFPPIFVFIPLYIISKYIMILAKRRASIIR